jgi:single-strand DNA-binding protein
VFTLPSFRKTFPSTQEGEQDAQQNHAHWQPGTRSRLNVATDGTPFTRFSIAVNRRTKNTQGECIEETEWFNVVAWRQLAELCHTYLHKGSKIYIEGRLTQRKYTDKNGIERTMVEVVATDVEFLTPKQAGSILELEPEGEEFP